MELRILGRKIQVRYVSDRELAQMTDESDVLGLFYNDTIYLSSSLTQEQARRVLFHEITHAVLNVSGLSNILKTKHEEAVCNAFESLADIFQDQELQIFLNKEAE